MLPTVSPCILLHPGFAIVDNLCDIVCLPGDGSHNITLSSDGYLGGALSGLTSHFPPSDAVFLGIWPYCRESELSDTEDQ